VAVFVGLVWSVYIVGRLYLNADEVLDCKLTQWMAGGKKPPDVDLLSNITFKREEDNIVADFRGLENNWSFICLTSFYAPGVPYFGPQDSHWGGGGGRTQHGMLGRR
jgi:hypothetical protein